MPSQSLQSLIDTFETLDASSTLKSPSLKPTIVLPKPSRPSPTVVTPVALRKLSLDNLLESPTSPTASSLSLISPIQPTPSSSRSPSPAILGRKSSLIDIRDFDPPYATSSNSPSLNTSKPYLTSHASSPSPPRLPPRRVSSSSSHSSNSLPASNSLAVHNYPPSRAGPITSRHLPASSTSSFHSISLSSDGGKRDSMNFDDSIEVISLSTAATTASPRPSLDYDIKPIAPALPKLPPRPPSSASNTSGNRRVPPPPPSIPSQSHNTIAHTIKVSQKPSLNFPIDPASRARYEFLFDRNLKQQNTSVNLRAPEQRPSRAWRGPSVDFTTALFGNPPPEASSTRLQGQIVKAIWETSKLSPYKLKWVWAKCNPSLHGSLDKEGFVKGMWLIDEELRRAQVASRHPRRKASLMLR